MQDIEFVKSEARIVYLLECLQKTPPPVLIFSEKKADVDEIEEYLLLKGVEAVGIHGGRDQIERDNAISAFKAGRKDVLVATDVASKGLDFPNIQHVINYDMPEDVDDYVHRIGVCLCVCVCVCVCVTSLTSRRPHGALWQDGCCHDVCELECARIDAS
jgi:ATP-dependent RNA helicase DDX41